MQMLMPFCSEDLLSNLDMLSQLLALILLRSFSLLPSSEGIPSFCTELPLQWTCAKAHTHVRHTRLILSQPGPLTTLIMSAVPACAACVA